MYDKYNQENSDIDSLPEPARVLLSEKEQLVNALQVRGESWIGWEWNLHRLVVIGVWMGKII